jgi:hypothetical protein
MASAKEKELPSLPLAKEVGGKDLVQADEARGEESLLAEGTRGDRPVELGDVAAVDSRVVEPLVWADASESLPGADPEEGGPCGPT